MSARWLFCLALLGILVGCGAQSTPQKMALLAPFEGRYREVGYEALYAVRLALADSNAPTIHLLAVDDGGSVATAIDRAQALQRDSDVALVLLLGTHATETSVQAALGDTPALIVGHWGADPTGDASYQLASDAIDAQLTLPDDTSITQAADLTAPLVGHEMLSLAQFPALRDDLQDVTLLSSGQLPNADFAERYIASDAFVPQPRLIAPLSYDAAALAIAALDSSTPLSQIVYNGLHGEIHFDERGYWVAAPIHEYGYRNGELVERD